MTAPSLHHKPEVKFICFSAAEAETGSLKCFCLVYICVCVVCMQRRRKKETQRRRGGAACNKWKFHFPCLSSLSQQLVSVRVSWTIFFSGFFFPANTLIAETTPPVCNNTACAFHKNFSPIWLWCRSWSMSICLWTALTYVYDPAQQDSTD